MLIQPILAYGYKGPFFSIFNGVYGKCKYLEFTQRKARFVWTLRHLILLLELLLSLDWNPLTRSWWTSEVRSFLQSLPPFIAWVAVDPLPLLATIWRRQARETKATPVSMKACSGVKQTPFIGRDRAAGRCRVLVREACGVRGRW